MKVFREILRGDDALEKRQAEREEAALAGAMTSASRPMCSCPATKANIASGWVFSHANVSARNGANSEPNRSLKVALFVRSASPMNMQSGSRRRM